MFSICVVVVVLVVIAVAMAVAVLSQISAIVLLAFVPCPGLVKIDTWMVVTAKHHNFSEETIVKNS